MSGAWPKVIPGAPLRVPASLHNRLIDVAREFRSPGAARLTPPGATQYFLPVLIRNTDEQYCPARGAMRLTGCPLDPTSNLGQFLDRPIFDAQVATDANSDQPAAIAVQRIDGGAIGEAAIDGIIQARVNITDADHTYAQASETTAFELESASGSGFRMIWKESGTGTKWALLEIPETAAPAAGGGFAAVVISSTTTASPFQFEYTIRAVDTFVGVPSSWTTAAPDLTAYNVAERVEFANFAAEPVSDGVGVIASEVADGVYAFSLAPIEGACS